jgi:hypothetical protein
MKTDKAMVIVEEQGPDSFVIRRVKNYTRPIMEGLVTGVTVRKLTLDWLMEHEVDVVIDQAGYKRRWTP